MTIELSKFIEPDLKQIGDYIAGHNWPRAQSFAEELREKILKIAENPYGYRLRPEIGDSARLASHGRYVILFRILGNRLRIERVVSGYRDLS